MTARVLIVDDIPTNVKLLEARLMAEYFDVLTACSGKEALEICAQNDVDLVLLDVMMPEMDGFEVCRRLKADSKTTHIPVVMITALDQVSDRVEGLNAGADDFLNKPVDDTQLMARVKSLVRLKSLTDELRARALTGQQIAIEDAIRAMDEVQDTNGRILLIDSDKRHGERVQGYLEKEHRVDLVTDPSEVVFRASQVEYELAIVSMSLGEHDPLRIYSQLRTLEATRSVPILLMADEEDRSRVARGLEMGVNDFIMRPIERNELSARVRTQIKRHRYAAELRESLNNTLQMAVVDDLTGLYNRRYFDRHLGIMFSKAAEQNRELGVMMIDLDHFKSVNDTHGHDAGDVVLREFAERLRRNIRGADLACRYGGEEFVVLMPDTDVSTASMVAERLRSAVDGRVFAINETVNLSLTVSIGIGTIDQSDENPEMLVKRADIAVYQAKHGGRNRVVANAA